MASDDSISQGVIDGVKDLGKETVKSTLDTISPTNVLKHVVGHVIGKNLTAEEEQKKKADDVKSTHRIQEIEEEMQRIRAEREKLTGPQIGDAQNGTNENLGQQAQLPQDIALQRAKTKVEGDSRANKG